MNSVNEILMLHCYFVARYAVYVIDDQVMLKCNV